ncbi:MAG: NAD(P)/FAD-dependent oxidoreductase [Dehalococcoidia bacterium]|nr:FAD-dependent monooxygenase [Dehalococcoidia bacterium]MCB9486304.1 FAD-dependent monooxygenase [Thermoflexaceae bacterium]
MYDVIVVGARCGGSPTAMNLAGAGHKVLVVDRATFPSDTLSTGVLSGDSVNRLRQWGLLEKVCAGSGTAVYPGTRIHVAGEAFDIPGEALCPRRTTLDKILVDAARDAGAEVREHCSVTGITRDGEGMVTGITFQSEGQTGAESARIVIGADGRNSFVARAVDAEVYGEKDSLACAYYSYFTGFPVDRNDLHFADGVAALAFPTDHGQSLLAVMQPSAAFEAWRADVEAGFRKVFSAVGLGDAFAGATRTEEYRGAAQLPNYYRKPFGPGWALVGDAGYLKDPVLGQGVNDAFRDADLLSAGLDRVFRGDASFEAAMSEYQQTRDAMTGGIYALNHAFSALKVTPGLVQTLADAAAAMQAARG